MNDRVIELLEKQCDQLDCIIELLNRQIEDKQRYVVIGQQPIVVHPDHSAVAMERLAEDIRE